MLFVFAYLIFFFQAEDGIRDVAVTGVQTCALPILPSAGDLAEGVQRASDVLGIDVLVSDAADRGGGDGGDLDLAGGAAPHQLVDRALRRRGPRPPDLLEDDVPLPPGEVDAGARGRDR